MTAYKISPVGKSARVPWNGWSAINAALLAAAIFVGGAADAAAAKVPAECAAKAVHRAASRTCPSHHLRAAALGRLETPALATTDADGDKLTPISSSVTAAKVAPQPAVARFAWPVLSDLHNAITRIVDQAPNRGQADAARDAVAHLPLDGSRVAANAADARAAVGDLASPGGFTMPSVPLPLAWAILLVGLLGLRALASGPRVARVLSWATTFPSRAAPSSSALDRVDPKRYALAPGRRSRDGRFVRAAASSRFGADT